MQCLVRYSGPKFVPINIICITGIISPVSITEDSLISKQNPPKSKWYILSGVLWQTGARALKGRTFVLKFSLLGICSKEKHVKPDVHCRIIFKSENENT